MKKLLKKTTYSDGTATHYTYDAAGNLTNATGSAGFVFDYIYGAASMLTGETIINGGVTNTLSRLYGAFRRPASTVLSADGVFAQATAYTYDSAGLLSAVAATNAQGRVFRLEYTNAPGLALGHRVTTPGGNVITRAVTRDPLRPHLVTGVTNLFNGSVISAWTYRYDAAGRVISRNADTFAYNARSEITDAVMYTNVYGYVYDPIGNRLFSSCNAATNTYTANHLNQYIAINTATPLYDADGNLLTDGLRSYTWDAENRLSSVVSNGILTLANTYDHQHRRIRKATPSAVHDFVYDGWNLLRETVLSNGVSSTVDYFWGKDISGSLQGAGGVGGLIAASIEGQFYFALYDNNGNITEYVDESGAVMASYAYDAFGNIISQSGPMVDVFRFRFSTKHHDPETGHYYFGYRFYDPPLGRWLNRDPVEESGGLNLYGFVGNDGINKWDYLGMFEPGYEFLVNSMNDHHFNQLKKKLTEQLKALCPNEPKLIQSKQSKYKTGCCEPSTCESEAVSMATAYISAMRDAYEKRAFPGGLFGNILITIVTLGRGGYKYPDGLCPGLVCGGWANMGETILRPITDGSNCWSYEPGKLPPSRFAKWYATKIKKLPTLEDGHAWSVLNLDGKTVSLDPWRSGGWTY